MIRTDFVLPYICPETFSHEYIIDGCATWEYSRFPILLRLDITIMVLHQIPSGSQHPSSSLLVAHDSNDTEETTQLQNPRLFTAIQDAEPYLLLRRRNRSSSMTLKLALGVELTDLSEARQRPKS